MACCSRLSVSSFTDFCYFAAGRGAMYCDSRVSMFFLFVCVYVHSHISKTRSTLRNYSLESKTAEVSVNFKCIGQTMSKSLSRSLTFSARVIQQQYRSMLWILLLINCLNTNNPIYYHSIILPYCTNVICAICPYGLLLLFKFYFNFLLLRRNK